MLRIWLEIPLGLKDTREWTECILFVNYYIPFKKNMHPVIHGSHVAACFS